MSNITIHTGIGPSYPAEEWITRMANMYAALRVSIDSAWFNRNRRIGRALNWRMTVQWTRDGDRFPTEPITNPHAAPDQMVAIHDWTDTNQEAVDLHNSPDTWGPSLARRLFQREAEGFKSDAFRWMVRYPTLEPPIPVPMTFQWKRMSDPMAGFFD